MQNNKVTIARLWPRYEGNVPSRAPIILGIDPKKYRTVCIYLKKSSDAPNYFEEKGLKVYYISPKKFFRIFNLVAVWKLARILRREKVDILHCHKHQATVYGTIAAMVAGTPTVLAHVHGLDRSKAPRRRFINSLVLRKVGKILTVGESVKEDVLKNNPFVSPQKVVSLGNSIDYKRFADLSISKEDAKRNLGLPSDSFVFGTVARMAPNKGQIYLIEAFEKVKQTLPSAQLIFAGDGRIRQQLRKAAEKTGLSDSIRFLGYRKNIASIYKAMDAYVLPSIGSEGLPRGLLEAMAAGVPCIGSAISGIPEILDDGRCGWIVPAKNANSLAEAMLKVANMPNQEVKSLTEKARRRVCTDYGHGVVTRRLKKIYEVEYKAVSEIAIPEKE